MRLKQFLHIVAHNGFTCKKVAGKESEWRIEKKGMIPCVAKEVFGYVNVFEERDGTLMAVFRD